MIKTSRNTQQGLTLIELLIVVGLIGVMAGVLVTVLDVQQQQNITLDAVRLSTTEKLAGGVEAFYSSEGYFPANTTDQDLLTYIKEWPTGRAEGEYQYFVSGDSNSVGILILRASVQDTQDAYKYRSEWKQVKICENLDVSSILCL